MSKQIRVFCENTEEHYTFPVGTSLLQMEEGLDTGLKYPALGAFVNNSLKELSYQIYKPKHICFIDCTYADGMRMIIRSLQFILYKATRDLFPDMDFHVENPVSNGIYCTARSGRKILKPGDIAAIRSRMEELVKADIPFRREEITTEEAIAIFENSGLEEKTPLLQTRGNFYTSVYYLDDTPDYYYGYLVPSTGYVKIFDLLPYYSGMLLRIPSRHHPMNLKPLIRQDKMLSIFAEFNRWQKILGVNNIGDLNAAVHNGSISELIKISEALHEKKVAMIADNIRKKRKSIRLILISGPSSSGKTTFAKRLGIQLKVAGIQPVKISMDNYFVNREHTPLDENGAYNFETIKAIDIALFNRHILDLLSGNEVEIPRFNFLDGKRYFAGDRVKIRKKEVVIVEGIHALNPELTSQIEDSAKYKIYVSALTTISIDGHNLIPTSDNRLARRIVRDNKFRGYPAANTIGRWPSVRDGEVENIFPFQENADVMFNSALLYELGVLKPFITPLLEAITPNMPEFSEARRLLKFFSYFIPISTEEIPPTSLMKEFLGGSSFDYE
ncbi:MAG: nucleoside kinase [Bacteroidales bacterium]|nr:nucleoside kinase [Bacteroidales bacterium]MDD2322780.1 nucleoside kinase [Bacteroidales bacterium]MDD3961085.1 nucleoside kinase [Bacteroidales bacterium]MDY0284807.1 nucleoside kinase [Bacteroidales bacterium]HPE87155.1 nucleoside kinase [Bacteroidales bacterium]